MSTPTPNHGSLLQQETLTLLDSKGIKLTRQPVLILDNDVSILSQHDSIPTADKKFSPLGVFNLDRPNDVAIIASVCIHYSTYKIFQQESLLIGGESETFTRSLKNPTTVDLIDFANEAIYSTGDYIHLYLESFHEVDVIEDVIHFELMMGS